MALQFERLLQFTFKFKGKLLTTVAALKQIQNSGNELEMLNPTQFLTLT